VLGKTLQIRVGFTSYTLSRTRHAGGVAPLSPSAAESALQAWAACSADALRSLHGFYGGPVLGGASLGSEHPLLQRLRHDLRAGRVALLPLARSDHAGSGFAVARKSGTAPLQAPASALPERSSPTPTAPPAQRRAGAPEPPSPEPELYDVDVAAQVDTLVTAASTGTPFCEECMRAAAR
jgi:hypothetical protein